MQFFEYDDAFNFSTVWYTLRDVVKDFFRYGIPANGNGDLILTLTSSRYVADVTFLFVCFTMVNIIKGK